MTQFRIKYRIFILPILVFAFVKCGKFVEIPPPKTDLTSENVYNSDATAASVLTGIYTSLSLPSPTSGSTINCISLCSGLSADELVLYGGATNYFTNLSLYYLNKLSSTTSGQTLSIWNDYYSKLYVVNLSIEKLEIAKSLTPIVKQHLIGEAKFLRAFFYFYLVNLYNDVPLTTSSSYLINSQLPRSPSFHVYQQIISDLKESEVLLSDNYVASDAKSVTTERVRPNRFTATALLAKAYLYSGKYDSAVLKATEIINNKTLYDTTSLNDAFLKNSREAIWQLQPVNTGWNTEDAKIFILPAAGPSINISSIGSYPVYLSTQFINNIEPSDRRLANWIGSVTVTNSAGTYKFFYPYKYKSAILNAPITEYLMVLRVGEQYLIRAEANAQLDNINESKNDLNIIRRRAGLTGILTNDKPSLLMAIQHERQIELFTEWGNRWLDLKRVGSIDTIMSAVAPWKNTTWSPNWKWYPIPLTEIIQDPNLVQNPGY